MFENMKMSLFYMFTFVYKQNDSKVLFENMKMSLLYMITFSQLHMD